jgi:hypothetical protein
MQEPKKEELDICIEFMVMGAGWAYWNPNSKALHEFDKEGNFLDTTKSEKSPSNRFTFNSKMYLKNQL